MTTPNSKFRTGPKEAPTEPFKRAVTSCLRAIAKACPTFLLTLGCTLVASVTLAADPSFKGEDAHASDLVEFVQGHLGEVISLDVTYKPLPAGNDIKYDGPYVLQIHGPNTLYPAAHASFIDRFQVINTTFNDIDREPNMRLRFKGTGYFKLIRRDTRIPFAEYQFIPAAGSEPERALFVKNRANPLR